MTKLLQKFSNEALFSHSSYHLQGSLNITTYGRIPSPSPLLLYRFPHRQESFQRDRVPLLHILKTRNFKIIPKPLAPRSVRHKIAKGRPDRIVDLCNFRNVNRLVLSKGLVQDLAEDVGILIMYNEYCKI
jgi:hypothetical protein